MKRMLACAIVTTLQFSLLPAQAADATAEVKIAKKDDVLEFRIGDAVVSRYHVGEGVAKPYFWPLNAPGDVPVTRGWPMVTGEPMETHDHVHQKSAWFCHGDVIPEGIELKRRIKGVEGVDFWSEAAGHGRILCIEVGEPKLGKDSASVATRNEWRTAEGVKILDESRTITLKPVGEARLFVLDIDLHASVCPITFGDTKEGSMGVRVIDQMTIKNGGMLVNAAGKRGEKDVWGYPSDWVDYTGTVNGKPVGIALFDDSENQYRACWHSREYGLSAANPFGRAKSGFPAQKGKTDLVKLAKGEHLKLRYGILLHAGDTQGGKVAEGYQAFVKK
jgi:Family of unknown function (DUF6807)